jgi:triacylglycerol lipase
MVPKLRSPIVLVHGFLGFDRLQVCGYTLAQYFADLPRVFGAAGNRVLVARVSPLGSVAERAAQLKTFLNREVPGEPVHLLAHSMGGLDSRYLISRLDMADRVLTLTTVGTPHRGTSFADWGLRRFGQVLKGVCGLFNLSRRALYDLSTAGCRAFNARVPDAPGVRYFSIAGRHQGDWRSPEWQIPYQIVKQAEGPNDGIVSVASATYGEDCEVWDGDHLSLINWLHPLAQIRGTARDRAPRYAALVRRLADEGF